MYPVLLFVYNRPKHLKQVLDALLLNKEAPETTLIIYSDGSKSKYDKPQVDEVRRICNAIGGFREVKIIEREINYGLANNIISSVSDEIKKYGSVIVLEDDLIVSPGFLKFMNDALEFYRGTDIFSISGYSPGIKIPENYKYTTYLVSRVGSWGWATWKDKWEQVDWDVKEFDQFITSSVKRKEFERGGNDVSIMLLKQQSGIINSWAIRFSFACYKLQNKVVYPVGSLVKNSGADGSGTHVGKSRKYETQLFDEINTELFCPVNYENPELIHRFRNFNTVSVLRRVINYFKLRKYLLKINRMRA